jgi:hypothetical protein
MSCDKETGRGGSTIPNRNHNRNHNHNNYYVGMVKFINITDPE